jgi:hypothetical protein
LLVRHPQKWGKHKSCLLISIHFLPKSSMKIARNLRLIFATFDIFFSNLRIFEQQPLDFQKQKLWQNCHRPVGNFCVRGK